MDRVGDEGMYWTDASWAMLVWRVAWRSARISIGLMRVGCESWGLRGVDCGELMDGLKFPDMLYL